MVDQVLLAFQDVFTVSSVNLHKCLKWIIHLQGKQLYHFHFASLSFLIGVNSENRSFLYRVDPSWKGFIIQESKQKILNVAYL